MGQGLDKRAMQRVQEKKFLYPLPPVSLINGEAPENSCRYQRMDRKSACDRCGQAAWAHAERRERVIAEDEPGGVRRDGNEKRGDETPHILAGHRFQVLIKDRDEEEPDIELYNASSKSLTENRVTRSELIQT
jgi:hypothetical protein